LILVKVPRRQLEKVSALTALYLRLLRLAHDELVQFLLVLCAEVLERGLRFGGDLLSVHCCEKLFFNSIDDIRWMRLSGYELSGYGGDA